mmetsp:Transcript_11931/g.28086  ORF Transcript_11931/g.28086 Transcript_11931/m.28086 type:complete len:217 (+) Transcript_11931:436-1086(+)
MSLSLSPLDHKERCAPDRASGHSQCRRSPNNAHNDRSTDDNGGTGRDESWTTTPMSEIEVAEVFVGVFDLFVVFAAPPAEFNATPTCHVGAATVTLHLTATAGAPDRVTRVLKAPHFCACMRVHTHAAKVDGMLSECAEHLRPLWAALWMKQNSSPQLSHTMSGRCILPAMISLQDGHSRLSGLERSFLNRVKRANVAVSVSFSTWNSVYSYPQSA